MKTFCVNDILARLKQALGVSTDVELGIALRVKKTTLSNWRTRNSIDFNAVFAVCEHINIDWLIFGRGNSSLESSNIEELPHSELFYRVLDQAQEIGRLRERIAQLEQRLGQTDEYPNDSDE